jgi:pyruvate formate lyase activating enzyme
MKCAEVCPSRALETIGKQMSVSDVLTAVEKDSCFFSRSGGGLTLSGGEPLAQADFAVALLKAAKAIGMDTAVETSGYVEWGVFGEASRYIDTIIYDIKCVDPLKHQKFTGVSNYRILANFRKLCLIFSNVPKVVRTPVIPGFNDGPGEIESIARFLMSFPNVKHELLPYHSFGEHKYLFIGRQYKLTGVKPPTGERMTLLRDFAN